ncbi:MAG: hypothetical protein DWI22_06905 [Planctomycetota bacterium]|jgi:hypothetical protein|nr:MAG: hypothetical protein DWI22_06905 [Planctomycetota bacterium]
MASSFIRKTEAPLHATNRLRRFTDCNEMPDSSMRNSAASIVTTDSPLFPPHFKRRLRDTFLIKESRNRQIGTLKPP